MEAKETLKKLIEKLRNQKKSTDGSNIKSLLQKSFIDGYSKSKRKDSLDAFSEIIKMDGCVVGESIEINEFMIDFKLRCGDNNFLIRVIKESKPYEGDANGTWGVNPKSLRRVN